MLMSMTSDEKLVVERVEKAVVVDAGDSDRWLRKEIEFGTEWASSGNLGQ